MLAVVGAVLLLVLALALEQELMLVDFVDRVIAVVLQLLLPSILSRRGAHVAL